MASKEHLDRLKLGLEAWNKWRVENPDIKPDLFEADLSVDEQDVSIDGSTVQLTPERGVLDWAASEGARVTVSADVEGVVSERDILRAVASGIDLDIVTVADVESTQRSGAPGPSMRVPTITPITTAMANAPRM